MKKKDDGEKSASKEDMFGSCKVESVVSVDERGQMVLPKDLREKAGIKPGDKLAVASWEKDGETCCIFLIKIEKLADMVKNILGPLTKQLKN